MIHSIMFLGITCYLVILVERSYISGGSLLWVVMGLRPILLILLVYTVYYLKLNDNKISKLSNILKIFIILQLPVCIFQLLFFPPIQGETIFGPRVFGTFPNPILLSQAACAIMLFLYINDRNRNYVYWGLTCFGLAIMSGGRSGMIGIALICLDNTMKMFSNRYIKSIVLMISFILVVCAYFLFSSSAFSGREIETFSKERRLANWGIMITGLVGRGYDNLLFGEFVGSGSNLWMSYAKKSGLDSLLAGRLDADSMFLYVILSYGIAGLVLFLSIMFYLFKNSINKDKHLIFGLFLWLGVSQNILEIYPVNIIFVILFGLALRNKRNIIKDSKFSFV